MELYLPELLKINLEKAIEVYQASPELQETTGNTEISFSGLTDLTPVHDISLSNCASGKKFVTSIIISASDNRIDLFESARRHPLIEPLEDQSILNDMEFALNMVEEDGRHLICDFLNHESESGFTLFKSDDLYRMGFVLALQKTKFLSLSSAYLRASVCCYIHPN